MILGPSVLGFILNGWSAPPAGASGPFDAELIAIFAGLGAIFLLFLIGIETDVRAVYKRRNVYVALGGVILPWVVGFLTAYLMLPGRDVVVATFVGATLVATSTAIAAASHSLRVDIVDAPVGCHLPVLDGIVEVERVQSPDPDQLRERRLDIAGLVGAP